MAWHSSLEYIFNLAGIPDTYTKIYCLVAMLKDSRAAIAVQDSDGNIQAWNCGAEQVYDCTASVA